MKLTISVERDSDEGGKDDSDKGDEDDSDEQDEGNDTFANNNKNDPMKDMDNNDEKGHEGHH